MAVRALGRGFRAFARALRGRRRGAPAAQPPGGAAGVLAARHWREVDLRQWPCPHFTPRELASRGDGSLKLDLDAARRLERTRSLVGRPLVITSAYRDPLHNAKVGGAPRSQHKLGRAFDILLTGHDRFALAEAARQAGFRGFGRYQSFLHVDTRPEPAAWFGGERSREAWIG